MSETSSPAIGQASAPSPSFSHAEILRVMSGLMICIFLAALDQTAVVPAVPAMGTDLGAYSQLSWIVAAYLITSTISTPVYGKLSDLYGRRRLLVTCLGFFIATSMLCAVAQSLTQLIWFRALQGLGGGGLMALTQAAIADVMSPRERGRYQGYLAMVWAIASLSGPLVGGFLTEHLSWRWIFWLNLPTGAAALWICQRELRRLRPPTLTARPSLDIIGMLLLAGSISSLLIALGWGGDIYPWASPEIVGLIGLGLILLVLLILQERRAADALLPPRIFRNESYAHNIVASTITSILLFTCLFAIPLYFQLARGSTAAQSGIYIAPFMLASATGNVAGSRWARRFGTMRGALRIGTALSCVGLLVLAWLPLDAPIWAVIGAMILTGLGVGACLIGTMMGAQNALGPKDIGAGTAALVVLRSVGGASGSTLAGAIISAGLVGGVAGGTALEAPTAAASEAAAVAGSLGWHFALVYMVAAAFAALSFTVTLRMSKAPLRGSLHPPSLSE